MAGGQVPAAPCAGRGPGGGAPVSTAGVSRSCSPGEARRPPRVAPVFQRHVFSSVCSPVVSSRLVHDQNRVCCGDLRSVIFDGTWCCFGEPRTAPL